MTTPDYAYGCTRLFPWAIVGYGCIKDIDFCQGIWRSNRILYDLPIFPCTLVSEIYSGCLLDMYALFTTCLIRGILCKWCLGTFCAANCYTSQPAIFDINPLLARWWLNNVRVLSGQVPDIDIYLVTGGLKAGRVMTEHDYNIQVHLWVSKQD